MNTLKTFSKILVPIVAAFAMMGCGGTVEDLALKNLYPFAQVNDRYKVPETPPTGMHEIYFDVPATDGTTMKIHAWFHKDINPNARVFVHTHGNGENLEALSESNFLGVVQQLGVHFIVIDYPGLGRSTGTPNQANLVNAAIAAIDWAHANFTHSKLVVWGRSLGAAVATLAAAQRQSTVDGLLLISPWNNFYSVAVDRTGLAKSLTKEFLKIHGYDSQAVAPGIEVPTLIDHGVVDTLIPIKFGRLLFQSFPQGVAEMHEIAGREHNDMYLDPAVWSDIKNFGK
jgi:pimeloyl-ACP methyl ester carboxylesterase